MGAAPSSHPVRRSPRAPSPHPVRTLSACESSRPAGLRPCFGRCSGRGGGRSAPTPVESPRRPAAVKGGGKGGAATLLRGGWTRLRARPRPFPALSDGGSRARRGAAAPPRAAPPRAAARRRGVPGAQRRVWRSHGAQGELCQRSPVLPEAARFSVGRG